VSRSTSCGYHLTGSGGCEGCGRAPSAFRSTLVAVTFLLALSPGQPVAAATTVDIALGEQDVTVYGADSGDMLFSVASGDLNDDGVADLVLGAPNAQGPLNSRTGAGGRST
jgi:hypothetical protein